MLLKKVLKGVLPIFLGAIVFSGLGSQEALADIGVWKRGAGMLPRSTVDIAQEQARESLANLRRAGATHVNFVVPYYQSNQYSVDIHRGSNTPTDDALMTAISNAKDLGLKVTIKIHLETLDDLSRWRAFIDPEDREGWFSAYGDILNHYAVLAESTGVDQLILGSELISMSTEREDPTNTQYWLNMIGEVRARFSGSLTYSANWGGSGFANEKDHIGFWSALDYIGLAAYFMHNNYGSVEEIKQSWEYYDHNEIRTLHYRYDKPVIFTEVGYRSMEGAHREPFNWWDQNAPSEETQARAYEALFDYWNGISYMQGVYLWHWEADPHAGGPGTTSYTPQNKQAEQVMAAWWKFDEEPKQDPPDQKEPTPDPVDEDPYTPENVPHSNFDIDVKKKTGDSAVSENVHFEIEILNKGASAKDVIVNVEIYNEAGGRVHQVFFEGQDIHSDSRVKYDIWHVFDKAGTYIIKVGIVGAGWSDLWIWNDMAYRLHVIDLKDEEQPVDPDPKPDPADSRQYHTWRFFKHPVFGENHKAIRQAGSLPMHAAHVAHHKAKISALSGTAGHVHAKHKAHGKDRAMAVNARLLLPSGKVGR
jgi:hypothetical protein